MGGCFGCCTKSTPVIAVDEPSKGLRIQGKAVKRPSISDDFWTSSTCDLENSAVQSQRSVSSISTSNQTISRGASSTSTSVQSEFVNHGLLLWNQTRLQWTGSNRSRDQTQQSQQHGFSFSDFSRLCSWNATYESVLTTKQSFQHPVPLSEMVEFLVEIWENEGLYD
ncbi:hypothetical protein UlMin_003066 [Ulmus minor]